MQINKKNHDNKINSLFGLLPMRFVYQKVEVYEPKAKSETLLKSVEEQREKIEKFAKEVNKKIDSYNNTADKKFNSWASDKKVDTPFKEPLLTLSGSASPEQIVQQIDKILASPFYVKEKWYTLLSESSPEKGRADKLMEIRAMLSDSKRIETDLGPVQINMDYLNSNWNEYLKERSDSKYKIIRPFDAQLEETEKIRYYNRYYAKEMEKGLKEIKGKSKEELMAMASAKAHIELLIKILEQKGESEFAKEYAEYMKAVDESALEQGKYLSGKFKELREMSTMKAGWEKSEYYQDLNSVFDNAVSNPLTNWGKDEFKELWEYSESGYSSTKFRQSKELFFSILARETNGFKSSFVLGENFRNSHEENINNFPFVYREWLEFNGINTDKINQKDAEITGLYTAMKDKPSAEDIADNNATAGISSKEFEDLDIKEGREYWTKREEIITRHIYKLRDSIASSKDDPTKATFIDGYEDGIKNLEIWREIAQQERIRSGYLKNKNEEDIAFTRYNLEKPQNQQILMELAMRKFIKSMEIVDKSAPHGDWRTLYHPAVRDLLIATVYKTGASANVKSAETGGDLYQETIDFKHSWLLAQLSQTPYFNREYVGEYLNPNQRDVLLVGIVANRVNVQIEDAKTAKKVFELVRDDKEDELNKYPKALVEKIKKLQEVNIAKFNQDLQDFDKTIELRKKFLQKAARVIKHPYKDPEGKILSEDTNVFIKAILNPDGEYKSLITSAELAEYQGMIKEVEFYRNAFDLREQSRMNYLDKIGINVEGMYQAYLLAITKDPSMHVDNWDDLFTSPNSGDFTKLRNFLDKILASSDTKGKESFLAVFEKLRGKSLFSEDPEHRDDEHSAIQIYTMLKLEIHHRETIAAYSDKEGAEIQSKLKGMHIGDKITKYAKGIINMVIGPGQSWANRGAGLVMVIAALKLGKKAIKGQDNTSKLLRLLFMAGAADIVTKQMTGRGLLDRAGLDSIEGAIEGTYEAVLMHQGEQFMDKNEIENSEHTAALYEMNKVSFDDLMSWYEKTDADGWPREGEADAFPRGINARKILRGKRWKETDKPREVRRIIKRTMDNFFSYVASKEKIDPKDAHKRLSERWIKMRDNPDYKPEHTDIIYHEMLEPYRKNKNQLTWKIVMRSEIDPYDVEKTKNEYGLGSTLSALGELSDGFLRWGRQNIYGPLRGHAKEFFESLDDKMEHDVKEFLADAGEAGARNLYFAKEKVVFEYESHKYEIRRFLGEHWELITTGLKLPFEVIYAADQLAIPWTLSKLKQIKESIRADSLEVPLQNRDLNASDIAVNGNAFSIADRYDIEQPQFKYFGLYQKPFLEAFNKGNFTVTPDASENAEYLREYPDSNVGYLITETKAVDAGVSPHEKDESVIMNKLLDQSYEEAKMEFIGKNVPLEAIEKYMFAIHFRAKKDADGNIVSLYRFWRMPMPGSYEYTMKESGRWADYINPNTHKDRPAFYVDPTKSMTENLKRAMTLNSGPMREVTGTIGMLAIQPLHFALGSLERIGAVATGIGRMVKKIPKNGTSEWIEALTKPVDEESQQYLDELTTSAENGKPVAMSEWYKNKDNATIYKIMLAYSRHPQQQEPPYLGIFEGQKVGNIEYKSTAYQNKPMGFSYKKVKDFYNKTWRAKNPRNLRFEQLIDQKIREEEREAEEAAREAARQNP